MLWVKQNARSGELQMAECDRCIERFHQKSQGIPDQVFQKTMEWFCNAYQQLCER